MKKLQFTTVGTLELSQQISTTDQISEYITEYCEDNVIKRMEYTTFEVFPTNVVIPTGTIDNFEILNSIFNWSDSEIDYINSNNIKFTNKQYCVDVTANDELFLEFYLSQSDTNDIVVDWGDGSTSILSVEATLPRPTIPSVINISHTYTSFKPTIVKIFGNGYYCIRNSSNYDSNKKSIIRRIFDVDQKMASNVKNVSAICKWSPKLQCLNIDQQHTQNIWKFCNAFEGCDNLIEADVGYMPIQTEVHSIFANCKNLNTVNFTLPQVIYNDNSYKRIFANCEKLTADLINLLPQNGFSMQQINMSSAFINCKHLTCSDYEKLAKLLWEDPSLTYADDTETAFIGCESIDLSQIPTFLGGIMEYTPPMANINQIIEENKILKARLDESYDGNVLQLIDGTTKYEPSINIYDDQLSVDNNLSSTLKNVVRTSNKCKSIPDECFLKFQNLESFTSDSITEIGDGSFTSCSKLSSLNTPNLKIVNDRVFNSCYQLEHVVLPGLTDINGRAFINCSNLKSFDAANVSSINFSPLLRCYNLSSININNDTLITITNGFDDGQTVVVSKDETKLYTCIPSLTSISNDNIVTIERSRPFSESKIQNIYFKNLKTITSYSFWKCDYVNTLYTPNLTKIEKNAFNGSNAFIIDLTDRIDNTSSITIDSNSFDNIEGGALSCKVTPEFANVLENDEQWKTQINNNHIILEVNLT